MQARYFRLKVLFDLPPGVEPPPGEVVEAADPKVAWGAEGNKEIHRGGRAETQGPCGHCIYCGALRYWDKDDRPLGGEHVIMMGIGGTLELKEASCRACEVATSRVETQVVASLFDVPRRALRVKTRAMTKNPKLEARVIASGGDREVRLPFTVHPRLVLFPFLSEPGILIGAHPEMPNYVNFWMEQLLPADGALKDVEGVYSPVLDTVLFAQFLAKIAHAYAIWELGPRRFKPYLAKVICDHFTRTGVWADRFYYVGGRPEHSLPSEALHELQIFAVERGAKLLAVVRIRLFALLGAPVYTVVAGEIDADGVQLLGKV